MANSGVKVDAKQVEAMLKDFAKGLQGKSKGARAGYFDGDTNNEGVSLANIALWNEYGTERIPPRPFLRNAQNKANKRGANLVKARLDEGTNVDEICAQLAVMLTDEIKNSIRDGDWKPNAPITIKGGWMRTKDGRPFYVKGKGEGKKPLMDTTQLLNSVHGAVVLKSGEDVFLPKE